MVSNASRPLDFVSAKIGKAVSAVMASLAGVPRETIQVECDQLEAKRLDESPQGGLKPEQLVRLLALSGKLMEASNP